MLNKVLIQLLLFIALPFCAESQNTIYEISKASKINFKISHMGFLTVKGEFKQYSGTMLFDNNMLKSISAEVLVASINTKDASRDKTITSKGYLNTKEYSKIKFQSTSVMIENSKKVLIGVMEIKGVKKEVKIPFEILFLEDRKKVQLKLQTKIRRKDFQLDFGSMNSLIGDKITIDLSILGNIE